MSQTDDEDPGDNVDPVTDYQAAVTRAEEAYEFMIAYAGQGIGREIPEKKSDDVREYIIQLEGALHDAHEAASAIGDTHEIDGAEQYEGMLADMAAELDEASTILDLLAAQDRVTSAQVDNINGMSVFQSVMMKLFFIDDLTEHHVFPDDPG